MPELLLGFNVLPRYGEELVHENLEIGLELLQELQALKISRIDLRNRNNSSYAKQEIVVVVDVFSGGEKHYLRLDTKNYRQNIENYLTLSHEDFVEGDLVIDFRIDRLAFIEPLQKEQRKELIRK